MLLTADNQLYTNETIIGTENPIQPIVASMTTAILGTRPSRLQIHDANFKAASSPAFFAASGKIPLRAKRKASK
jgi:hypothetical protein